ncbi:MAG: tRNA lysidine(34) synthetase TilS [Bacteroidia bacterium]
MLSAFTTYIKKQKLFSKTDKILLTVSGGVDSVAMCELFHKAGYSFAIAHCNFQLRGKESDADETFVEALAEGYGVEFHSVSFNTPAFAKKEKLSIQAAARSLRYDWFEEVRTQFGYDVIATAHHSDDSIETFFINLIRGTGISGLHGIQPKHGNIARPLLCLSKKEIIAFATKSKLKYREDSSNASDKYLRNKIRNKLIPLLEEMNPSIGKTILDEIQRISAAEKIYREAIDEKRKVILRKKKDTFRMPINVFQDQGPSLLFELLRPFGFSSATSSEIFRSLKGSSGKQFFSETHRVIRDREELIIEATKKDQGSVKNQNSGKKKIRISKAQKEILLGDCSLRFRIADAKTQALKKSKDTANLDLNKLKFPLELRRWREGDRFQPFGMKGKKKLSDFFIDEKLSLDQKENTWLLCSEGNIVWVAGMRIDDRFRVSAGTKKIFVAELV